MRLLRRVGAIAVLFQAALLLVAPSPVHASTNNNAASTSGDRASTLIIGRVTDNPGKTYWKLFPLVRYVADQLSSLGIRSVDVVMASSLDEMINLLKAGEVDWVTESAYGALRYIDEAGAEPILVERDSKGDSDKAGYRSVIFSRADSGINSLEDLGGHYVAFEDPSSTSGYLIPKAELIKAGLTLIKAGPESGSLAANQVGYFFSGGEANSSALVYAGRVGAAGLSDKDWKKNKVIPPRQRGNFHIIHQSAPYPSRFELLRKDLDAGIKRGIQRVLLSSPQDPDAFSALDAFPGSGSFSLLSKSHYEALEAIRTMRQLTGD